MIGDFSEGVLDMVLETVPIEFSVLDVDDRVVGWNKHETRLFKRPEPVIGKDVRKCHPQKSLHKVEKILEEMKSGERDKARFWIDLPLGPEGKKEKVVIEYYALRDTDHNYLGCLEVTQNVSEYMELKGDKRLLD